MNKRDLRSAIVGIVISNMEQYDNEPITIMKGEKLHKSLNHDMDQMHNKWWKTHFPMFHYTVSVNVHSGSEPSVVVNWTLNGNLHEEWDRLTFIFKPARLTGEHDPLKAYERAMAVI